MSNTDEVVRLPEETDLAWSAFQAWMAMPRPRTQQALSAQLGVHYSTISNWTRDYRWKEREPKRHEDPALKTSKARIKALREVRKLALDVFRESHGELTAIGAGRLVVASIAAERAEEDSSVVVPMAPTSGQQWDLTPLTLAQIRVLEALIAVCGARDDGRPATPEELALLERINALDS
jgi:hypothetical protein